MSELDVIHLVRLKNGQAPFARFLESYRRNPGGVPHDLIFLYKGFGNDEQLRPYEALAACVPHRNLRISDAGLDIWAYFQAASQLQSRYFCALNSYSRPLDPDWLKKLWIHAQDSSVGAVGATGSYQSFHSRHLQVMAPTRGAAWSTKLAHVWRLVAHERDRAVRRRRIWSAMLRVLGMHNPLRDFPPFPNPHLRTNGFMIARDLFRQLEGSRVFTKRAAFGYESGVNSMTNQILRRGMRVLVVGRDGNAYAPEQWPASATFRLGTQSNLLIADNQTDLYDSSDEVEKKILSEYAWGNLAGAVR